MVGKPGEFTSGTLKAIFFLYNRLAFVVMHFAVQSIF